MRSYSSVMNSETPTKTTPAPGQLRSVDRELLDALRDGCHRGISDLTEQLGVTATAVRQRVDRLLEDGLIERHKVVAGRGRPTYNYSLTVLGHRHAGANHADLADAMWQEIIALPEGPVRTRLLGGIARRLAEHYKHHLDGRAADSSLEKRMRELSRLMTGNRIPANVTESETTTLPVLGITACPYPDLTDVSEQRSMCQLEEQMLSEALGQPVELTHCRLDGDACCQFSPKP